jgi:hypothetical protein
MERTEAKWGHYLPIRLEGLKKITKVLIHNFLSFTNKQSTPAHNTAFNRQVISERIISDNTKHCSITDAKKQHQD